MVLFIIINFIGRGNILICLINKLIFNLLFLFQKTHSKRNLVEPCYHANLQDFYSFFKKLFLHKIFYLAWQDIFFYFQKNISYQEKISYVWDKSQKNLGKIFFLIILRKMFLLRISSQDKLFYVWDKKMSYFQKS